MATKKSKMPPRDPKTGRFKKDKRKKGRRKKR